MWDVLGVESGGSGNRCWGAHNYLHIKECDLDLDLDGDVDNADLHSPN